MPLFNGPEYYYGTLLHELVHWTGAEKRLDREKGKRFGDDAYAMEELVAEIGAAFMCAEFGIESTTRDDHASYIKNWLEVLQKDKKAIVSAASMAEKAVAFMQEKVGEQAVKEAA
jgi:antirestriction protein ArdC